MVEKLKIFNFKPLVSSYSTYSTTGGGQDNLFRREDKENIGNTSGDNNYILIVKVFIIFELILIYLIRGNISLAIVYSLLYSERL